MKALSNRTLAVAVLSCFVGVSSAYAQKKAAPKRKPAPRAAPAAPAAPAAAPAPAPASPAEPAAEPAAGGESAAAPAAPSGYRAAYGLAGCGLGSIVFKSPAQQSSKLMQILAVTLNGTGYQTFGLTTGTSNCGASPAGQARLEQEIFFSSNFHTISKEAAQGQGTSLSAFAEVLGCKVDDVEGFAKMTQENYSSIFSSEEPVRVLDNYLGALKSNPDLSGKCTRA